jgi:Primosomal protein N'' (replication factor Y) - superfamily II helicase
MKNTKQPTNRRKRRDITPAMWQSSREDEKCVVVLGSATPSLESYHNATIGKYRLVTLTQRVDQKQMPLIVLSICARNDGKGKKAAILSEKLSQAIADRLEKREQTILF